MNIKRLQKAIKSLLTIAGADMDIKLYFPQLATPWTPPVRFMAWDVYAPRSVDDTKMARYGGKTYYLKNDPLSVIMAKQQLLMGIAHTLQRYFLGDNWALNNMAFRIMLEYISVFAALEIYELTYNNSILSHSIASRIERQMAALEETIEAQLPH